MVESHLPCLNHVNVLFSYSDQIFFSLSLKTWTYLMATSLAIMHFDTLLWRLWTKNKDYDIMRYLLILGLHGFCPLFLVFKNVLQMCIFFCLALNHYKVQDKMHVCVLLWYLGILTNRITFLLRQITWSFSIIEKILVIMLYIHFAQLNCWECVLGKCQVFSGCC